MTTYTKKYTVKIKRKIVAWEVTTYDISCLEEEEAIKIAINENVYQNSPKQNGIIKSTSDIDKKTIRRLNQEESWLTTIKSGAGLGEIPKGELVVEVLAEEMVRLNKKYKHENGYWKSKAINKNKKT
jgi:hypothetical protein